MNNLLLVLFQIAIVAAVLAFGVYAFREKTWFKNLLRHLLNERPPPVEHPKVDKAPPPPPPPPPPPLPLIGEGNVREVPTEIDVLPPQSNETHVFPDRLPPKTRFEEFNWRLFTYTIADGKIYWPDTLPDDFATPIRVRNEDELISALRTRLRPQQPVILDRRGWWANASRNLEMDPDYEDLITTTYLGIPAEKRPAVISAAQTSEKGAVTFFRYGFEPFHLFEYQLKPFTGDALTHVLDAFVGDRAEWKWFSIARMRQQVVRSNRAAAQIANVKEKLEAEKKRIAHENRFNALWATVVKPQGAIIESTDAENKERKP